MTRPALRASLVLAVVFLTYGALNRGSAQATTIVSSPYGTGVKVQATIGSCSSDPCQLIVWQSLVDLTCKTTVIGDGVGLFDNYEVHGNGLDDNIEITPTGPNSKPCGFVLLTLAYNGHYLDLYGGAGNDLLVQGTSGDTWLFGEDGNDFVMSRAFGNLFGGNGNDEVNAAGPFTTEGLYGEAGNDCLWDNNASAAVADCGAGTDRIVRTPSGVPVSTGCESVVPNC